MNKTYINLFLYICIVVLLSACQLSKKELDNNVNLLIIDANSDTIIKIVGDCQVQETPCSTFKIALSLMGFDAGILKNEQEPEFLYKDEYNAPIEVWKQSQTPQTWITHSCVWYSRIITSMLGIEKFQRYVNYFNYGNQDISGTSGKNDGLGRSWLCSSLKISPIEQTAFIKKLLQKKLSVSEHAYQQTQKLLHVGNLQDGWELYGKAGAGMFDESDNSIGWFVGWITNEKTHKTFIFACLVSSNNKNIVVNGNIAKLRIIDELLKIVH
jgi:beta-lactamase class D